jgi:hypothetical protein
VHRGPDAVYLDVDGSCVGVVGTRATAVPCAVRTALDLLPEVTSASMREGVLHLDEQALVVGRLVDVTVGRLARSGACPEVRACQPRRGPGAIDVASLVGAGDGLTPYGDDVICGWLAVHRATAVPTPDVDEAVRGLWHRTTLLSATLLDCAMHGEVIPEFAAWLAALGTEDEEPRAAVLARVGHTSGRGLLEGARRALADLERVAA